MNRTAQLVVAVVLLLLLLGLLPVWPYSGSWGYIPGGVVGLLLIIVVVMIVLGDRRVP
jgi:hypothetical protein